MVKKLTAAAMAVVMVMGMSVIVSADTCTHSMLNGSISGPYHYEYTQHDHDGDGVNDCTITRTIGILSQRCIYCGTIVYQEATTAGISHSYNN